jgi:ATP-dependent DNA helicase RecG
VEIQAKNGFLPVVWFNQPYLLQTFKIGESFSFSGKAGWFNRRLALISPEYERLNPKLIHTQRLLPIYPETAGVSSKWLRRRISEALEKVELKDPLPKKFIEKYNLVNLKNAISFVHFPNTQKEFDDGKRRLAFDELLSLQIKSLNKKALWKKKTHTYPLLSKKLKIFFKSLPFTLTKDQKKAIKEISSDLKKNYPMNRLLQGEVGSGKTVVAAATIFAALENGQKSVLIAPTQILAYQHFNTLKQIFKPFKAKISLLTSSTKIHHSNSQIIIGTHALLTKHK